MKRAFFSIADNNNLKFFNNMKKSLEKFHPDIPLILIGEEKIKKYNDPYFFYRATPIIAQELLEEYDELCKIDADSIIVGDLSDVWKGNWDVATVLNDPTYPIRCWDIEPYFNNGFNIFKSRVFIDHWKRLCFTKHFMSYQFREQDLMNILCSDYHDYRVKCLDYDDKVYGEFAKPVWAQCEMKDGKVMINNRQLCVIHFGGGNSPDKGNYRIRFKKDVIDYIESLIK